MHLVHLPIARILVWCLGCWYGGKTSIRINQRYRVFLIFHMINWNKLRYMGLWVIGMKSIEFAIYMLQSLTKLELMVIKPSRRSFRNGTWSNYVDPSWKGRHKGNCPKQYWKSEYKCSTQNLIKLKLIRCYNLNILANSKAPLLNIWIFFFFLVFFRKKNVFF